MLFQVYILKTWLECAFIMTLTCIGAKHACSDGQFEYQRQLASKLIEVADIYQQSTFGLCSF